MARRDPVTTATEMIKASINRRPGRMLWLWVTSSRQTQVAFVLTDIAAGFLQENIKDVELQPGVVLNRIAREGRNRRAPWRSPRPEDESS